MESKTKTLSNTGYLLFYAVDRRVKALTDARRKALKASAKMKELKQIENKVAAAPGTLTTRKDTVEKDHLPQIVCPLRNQVLVVKTS